MARKTWKEKLFEGNEVQVKPVPTNIAGMKKGQVMLIPSGKIIDDFVKTIQKGKYVPIQEMRAALAKAHKAEVTCPITTGFHVRAVCEYAYECYQQGSSLEDITPFWRVLDEKTPTLKKLSIPTEFIAKRWSEEGLG